MARGARTETALTSMLAVVALVVLFGRRVADRRVNVR
jgi:hypothetical protein